MKDMSVPVDVTAALDGDAAARAAFDRLPPSHQRAYLQWIEGARQAATRERRVRGMIERLKQDDN
jgi:uncharacterized protein YdeI (YjbR/CyaY-like superfamily)